MLKMGEYLPVLCQIRTLTGSLMDWERKKMISNKSVTNFSPSAIVLIIF